MTFQTDPPGSAQIKRHERVGVGSLIADTVTIMCAMTFQADGEHPQYVILSVVRGTDLSQDRTTCARRSGFANSENRDYNLRP